MTRERRSSGEYLPQAGCKRHRHTSRRNFCGCQLQPAATGCVEQDLPFAVNSDCLPTVQYMVTGIAGLGQPAVAGKAENIQPPEFFPKVQKFALIEKQFHIDPLSQNDLPVMFRRRVSIETRNGKRVQIQLFTIVTNTDYYF